MSQNMLMAIPMIGLSGIRGALFGGGAIVGFGVGRSFGRMACEKMDSLEDSLAASVHPGFERLSDRISSFSERWR
tara:strand:+ start:1031 stop:1255 length:225 start_codon:yes stop_codon:yes gene_type:complete